MSKLEDKIKGVLCIFFETGYEGSPWAFNDPRYNYENKDQYTCKKCGRYWDKTKNPEGVEDIEGDYCEPKKHNFELSPEIFWSYEGLHILRNGDYLKIFNKENIEKILWEGEVKIKEIPRKISVKIDNKVREVGVIRYHPEGVDLLNWMKWFDEEYPGELTKKDSDL